MPRNLIPAARATASVPPTVVAPVARWAAQAARSRGPSLRASGVNRSSSLSASPTRISPSRTPTVAGTAPAARTRCSLSIPTATPSGAGNPWAIRVVSSATTARSSASAVGDLVGQLQHARRPYPGIAVRMPLAMAAFDRSVGRNVFGRDPALYARARPGYPERVFEVLRERCGLRPGAAVLEIGPGPGSATRRLLELGARPARRGRAERRHSPNT